MGTGPAAARVAAERAVARLCARALPPDRLLEEAAGAVRRGLPYTAAGWMVSDPVSGVTAAIRAEKVDADVQRRLIELEQRVPDVNSFAALASRRSPVARLSAATRGRLADSARHRELSAPLGLGDEMRGVFRAGGQCWGQVCLSRSADDPWFDAAEERSLARMAASVGTALRRAHALARAEGGGSHDPGILLLGEDGRVFEGNDAALGLLQELPGDGTPLPAVVQEVAVRARVRAATGSGPPARARVRGRGGRYLVVRASVLDGALGSARVAVLLEPAGRPDLAPLVVAAAGLTEREREVAGLLLDAVAEAEIARRLWLSAHTVHGYVKAVFVKVGVSSRAELAALLGGAPGSDASSPWAASDRFRPG